MSIDIEDVRKRSEWFQDSLSGEGSIGGYGMAAAAIKSAEDVPALLDEVEALREMLKAVKPRDDYLITRAEKAEAEVERLRAVREEWRRLYSNAEAERDRLRAAVDELADLARPQGACVRNDVLLAVLNAHLGGSDD